MITGRGVAGDRERVSGRAYVKFAPKGNEKRNVWSNPNVWENNPIYMIEDKSGCSVENGVRAGEWEMKPSREGMEHGACKVGVVQTGPPGVGFGEMLALGDGSWTMIKDQGSGVRPLPVFKPWLYPGR